MWRWYQPNDKNHRQNFRTKTIWLHCTVESSKCECHFHSSTILSSNSCQANVQLTQWWKKKKKKKAQSLGFQMSLGLGQVTYMYLNYKKIIFHQYYTKSNQDFHHIASDTWVLTWVWVWDSLPSRTIIKSEITQSSCIITYSLMCPCRLLCSVDGRSILL